MITPYATTSNENGHIHRSFICSPQIYSQTCIQRPLLGRRKSGHIRQVVLKRMCPYNNYIVCATRIFVQVYSDVVNKIGRSLHITDFGCSRLLFIDHVYCQVCFSEQRTQ